MIVGELGYKAATSLTAVGDAVNAASRLAATMVGRVRDLPPAGAEAG